MLLPEYNARDMLAANVQALMKANPAMDSATKLARHCFWPAGNKKGRRVSERQIRYVLNTRTDGAKPPPSPTLDVIVAIGNAFNTPAWMLLSDVKQLRLWAMGKLFTSEDAAPDLEVPRPSPAKAPAMKRAKKAR